MANERKPSVDITNRPSDQDSHTTGEWRDHIHVRESHEALRDIRTTRQGLHGFTARFVIEALCAGEKDSDELIHRMLQLVDGDELVGDMKVDRKALRKLADHIGGPKTKAVVENSPLRDIQDDEPKEPVKDVADQQVELLRALLKTMDPEVVKKALIGG